MMGKYKLVGHNAVPCDDSLEWSTWFETADRHVADDTTPGGTRVSTVFIGIDHSFGIMPGPVLFETVIFGGPADTYQDRYRTWDEAVSGHANALAMALAADHPRRESVKKRKKR
jgi:hypothetical protein